MIKSIIVDDEKHCIITLQHLISEMDNIEVVASTQESITAKELTDLDDGNGNKGTLVELNIMYYD